VARLTAKARKKLKDQSQSQSYVVERQEEMTTLIRMLANTIHSALGSVRRGDVVDVPDDIAAHLTENRLAEEAQGAEPTRGTPMVEDTEGHWVEDQAEIDRRNANRPPDARIGAITRADVGGGPSTTFPANAPTVAEPTSGPMTDENGAEAPAAPTVGEVANPGDPGTVPDQGAAQPADLSAHDARPPEEHTAPEAPPAA
jgi:hypothetical protein